jgi:hypothetical protein
MLVFLTLLIMLGVCYAYWHEGLLTACCMFINVLLAGLIAFSLFEPLADQLDPMLADSFLAGYEDCFSLILLFSVSLGLLRMVTNNLAFTTLDYPPALLHGGGVFFGALTGYLVSGFLLCAFQTLPLPENFLKFDARFHPDNPTKAVRRLLPPDRAWLALMHRAGLGPLSWGEGPTFDANGNFELRYARYRRKEGDKARKDDGLLPAKPKER